MSGDIGLGRIVTGVAERDAVHVAVAPVVAGQELAPGVAVAFRADSDDTVVGVPAGSKEAIGVVDPFLRESVRLGQRFWLWLTPGSITSLRHDWTHPAFGVAQRGEANVRLQDFANRLKISLNVLLEIAMGYAADDGTWLYSNSGNGESAPETFWADVATVTGTEVPDKLLGQDTYFSCSC